ncbi:unnamed protein product [Nesidiocoris tenuis]|uniref:Uncharacterized protein n=1 Tax=Nesidiocoris tenuis TaxID=355587 RepID=A0A6H5H8R7_9HEMI|nr:unnamed protein product [Nesidiocoris tenuis]
MKVMPAIPIVPADPSHPPLEGTLALSRSSTHHPTQQLEFNFKKRRLSVPGILPIDD